MTLRARGSEMLSSPADGNERKSYPRDGIVNCHAAFVGFLKRVFQLENDLRKNRHKKVNYKANG